MQTALDGTGLLAFNQIKRPILEPNAHNGFGIVIVLVLSFIKEIAIERPTVAVVGGGDGLEPDLHLALHLDAVIAVDSGGIGGGELALEIVGVVGLKTAAAERTRVRARASNARSFIFLCCVYCGRF